jgi:phospholipase/carboxylesterase
MTEPVNLSGPLALPAAGGDPRAMVILLHGYGSNGDDLIGLAPYWRDALPHVVFLAPNAPERCPMAPGGYQWWPLTDFSPQARAAGARAASPTLDGFIDAQLARYALPDDKLVLVGFSQGAMMALHVGPRRKQSPAGVIGYSGMLADTEGLAELRGKPPILLVHGDLDPTVPVAALYQAQTVLESLGFDLTTHVSAGLGHSIDAAGLSLGGQFLRRVLA